MVPAARDDRVRATATTAPRSSPRSRSRSGSSTLVPGIGPLGAATARRERRGVRRAAVAARADARSSSGTRPRGEPCCSRRLFPTAFFLYAPYTESLFLLASVACVLVRTPRPVGLGGRRRRDRRGDPQRRHPADPRAVGRGGRAVPARSAGRCCPGSLAAAAVALGPAAVLGLVAAGATRLLGAARRPAGVAARTARTSRSRRSSHAVQLAWRYQTLVAARPDGRHARRGRHRARGPTDRP